MAKWVKAMSKSHAQKHNEWRIGDAICAKQWCTNYKMGHELHWWKISWIHPIRDADAICFVDTASHYWKHTYSLSVYICIQRIKVYVNCVCVKRMLCYALLGKCVKLYKTASQNMHDRIYRPPKQTFTHLNE